MSVEETFLKTTTPILYDITKDQVFHDFKKLQEYQGDFNSLSRVGMTTGNHYFLKHRIQARNNSNKTYMEICGDDDYKQNIINKVKKFYPTVSYKNIYLLLCWRGSIVSQFRPLIAKTLFETLGVKRILDPCCGWGDRLVGAMATKSVETYIGIDSNTDMKDSYETMVRDLNTDKDIQIILKPCEQVDFSVLEYDCVFTSPPYYNKETYKNSPTYTSYNDWVNIFLKPMLEKSFNHLKENGYICINITDHKTYKIRETVLGILRDAGGIEQPSLQYIIRNRQTKVSASKYEPIIVFQKSQCQEHD